MAGAAAHTEDQRLMPELPEVETVARRLRGALVGETVAAVEVRWEGSVATPAAAEFVRLLAGRTVTAVGRRGKFLLLHVDPHWLIVHLRMTGQLLVPDLCAAPPRCDRHVHVILSMASGRQLYFRDARKFGRLWLVPDPAAVVGTLGVEPLDEGLAAEAWAAKLASRRRQLKPALLDQRFLAGLGNIYVDEALWSARLHPLRRTDTLSPAEAERLRAAIRAVLLSALADGGTTMVSFRDPCNEVGGHAPRLDVYGRRGAPCPRCGTAIARLVVGQRGTHVCPRCQP
ncbi:MAG: bifunctional DNA-formamidopyrimidine glycosylase/DNA-(apurinic or apyrimidinic site) lyase, partial [Chloroflexota bacterium]